MSHQQLADELHKPITRKSKKYKVYLSFKDNISCADLADVQLISNKIKGIPFSLYVIDVYIKYVWVVPLKDKKGIAITNVFEKLLDESEISSLVLAMHHKPKRYG